MHLRFGKILFLATLLLMGSYFNLHAQKARSDAKSKQIVVTDSTESSACVINTDPNRPPPTKISGGILNNKALDLPKPDAVRNAEGRKLGGRVSVQVVIGEDGTVTSASGVSGDKRLMPAAESAAMRASFKPTLLSGNPVKVSGLIWYKF